MKKGANTSEVLKDVLFIPTAGSIRPIPERKQKEYQLKYRELGPFTFHPYDIDICKLYRQVDDLKTRYKFFGGLPYKRYVEQIKDGVRLILKDREKDADFYSEHFYYVINCTDIYYRSYLGLFLSLGNALEIVPILEYHYEKFMEAKSGIASPEDFLNELEYTACNFIRTNRFPEDYYIKHDKIINWIFSKRQFRKYETALETKIELLVNTISKMSGTRIPSEAVAKIKPKKTSAVKQGEVCVKKELEDVLFNDLKDCFSENSHEALKQLFKGTASADLKVIFMGNANQLVDVFRIYAEDKKIASSKREIGEWICHHFMYLAKNESTPNFFDRDATENMIYGQRPPSKNKRIALTALEKSRPAYY
jgi:hypothetical protein